MNENKKRKVFLYGRVSTDQQTGGLESQVRALKEYCAMNKITEYEIFTDENQSGTKVSRPALDRMMAAVKNGECSCLVVYSFSRFARSITHLMQGLEALKAQQTSFVSLTERIETDSPIGKAVFVIIGAIAQLERDLICERVKNGLANARAKGKLIGRKKLRDSDLIRKLLKSGLSYRAVAGIAKCSHGSVHAEVVAMRKDALALEKKKVQEIQLAKEQAEALAKLTNESKDPKFPDVQAALPTAA
jgi:DNA invertase Pin-like site-specific DNA recombinase